jgi:CPA2 family monovalent cation:H+ antiporter-2
MSQLPTLIADLALILICAGVMTLLFKKLKQPLVLGYVVAGFLASPHMPYTPSVMDTANIKTWADIGVIFLLFALGLEFSFKKIVKVGGSAIIAACTIIFCMILLGIGVGICGLARNPATTYPKTRGCFNFLNNKVITPAQINISARSAIRVGN